MRARLLFAAAVALVAAPGAASAQDDPVADSMVAAGWQDVRVMSSDTAAYFGGLINRLDWNNPAPECANMKRDDSACFGVRASQLPLVAVKHWDYWIKCVAVGVSDKAAERSDIRYFGCYWAEPPGGF